MSNSGWDVRARHVGRWWGRREEGGGALGAAGLGVGVVAITDVAGQFFCCCFLFDIIVFDKF